MASWKQDQDQDQDQEKKSKSKRRSKSKMRDEDEEEVESGEEECYEVVVVGAGIMGSCTAYEAAKRGASVMLVEQYDLLHARGSSHGETRNMRSTYPEAHYTDMVGRALQLWDAAQAEAGYRVHTETPHLDFGPAANRSLSACVTSCSAAGVPFEELASPAQLAARFRLSVPDLPGNSGDRWRAVVTPRGGVIHAAKAVAMFQALALKHGAKLRDRARVLGLSASVSDHPGFPVCVHTERGCVHAARCVLAAGAWTPRLVHGICGLRLPITPLHTTLAYWNILPPPPQQDTDDDDHDAAVIDDDDAEENNNNNVAAAENIATTASATDDGDAQEKQKQKQKQKQKSGIVSKRFGATDGFPSFSCYSTPYIYGSPSIELPGLLKVGLHSGYECDPDERALHPDMEALKRFVSPWLEKHLGGQVDSREPVLAEPCMYSMTPDEDFILDFLPIPGPLQKLVLVAAGFSGHGFKMAPLIGKAMADLCLHGSCDDVPLHRFSLSRFDRDPRGNVKDYDEQVLPLDAGA